ncbi:Putative flavin monooxygenase, FAD/NAD(P)-binding domain superfamily [Septoria linicola]|uniref:Flavin monooxygenase, FAD/NAD(P)-binding domain superfamily n=1 Tax=Septoria linicola TaxID=215465 RepID=A0A9Q9EHV1_9PEZI|nr:putative flavin monooxygenase, FAD/NAD(P)-binding domain superfamily [Septoria linicola]USW52186.1 Putative flavin monooxygenase, FAD/NAD(P)-binding domain superfamily [Septoria linicola]
MAGDKPWPEVPIGNANHANAAVVIIGGGISGMCVAIDLIKRNKCRNFIVLEKSAGVGGTWLDNKYPGCCCDVWSALYSYSFAKNPDWTREYPGQEEILQYLMKVAQDYKLYSHFRFNTSVEGAKWDDKEKKWTVSVKTAPGSKEAEFNPAYDIKADFVVSAVGQLNQPKWPEIPGVEEFDGKRMHSSRWDWSYDLKDKKIAMIGNGCTSVQILPEIAKVAKQVTLFQRTPNWVVPRLDAPVSDLWRTIYKYVPGVMSRKRAAQMDFREEQHGFIAQTNDELAKMYTDAHEMMMKQTLVDRPDLWDKLTPQYGLGCKRIIISDDYFPAIARDNVSLETRSIDSIQGSQVKVKESNGEVVDSLEGGYDLLVCATGFKTTQFMHPIELTGLNDRNLSEIWRDGAKALYGMTVEDIPNFGMLYGPNTNLGHNSIILMIEAQSRYINGLIKPVLDARKDGHAISIKPKKSVLEDYNQIIQKELQNSAFNDPNCNSWYKNDAGLITNNWSRTVVQYQEMVENVEFERDFDIVGSGREKAKKKLHVGRVKEESYVSDRTLMLMGAVSSAALVGGWVLRNTRYLQGLRAR